MRTSNDIYKTKEGQLIEVDQMTEPPTGSIIWQGYDYTNQYWVFKGKKDTRTLEELKKSINK